MTKVIVRKPSQRKERQERSKRNERYLDSLGKKHCPSKNHFFYQRVGVEQ